MLSISAQIHVKDNNGNLLDVNPNTSIANVSGLQSELNGKVSKVKVGSTAYNPSSGVVSLPAYPTTLPASDVSSWAKAASKPTYTASEVGAIATTAKGAASGVAELDANGKVPSSQLPAYVDDVLEYTSKSSFPTTGETGKIYVDTTTNLTYRWSGSAYVEISPSLALGTTSSTAYRGDRGNTSYSHATDSSRLTTAQSSGLYKIATTAQGHIASVTAVAKSDITGLGIPGSDTNTHRPIQVNGTQVLGDNTTALNLKAGSNVSLSNSSGTVTIAATDTTYSAATQSANGLMSSTDKTKLDGIATGATANIGTVTQVKVGSTAYNPSSGVISLPAYPSDTNTHRPIQMNGTEILGNNTTALNLKAGSNVSLSNSSGTVTIAATDTTYSAATQSANGLMSSTDKTKLDGIATGATANVGTVTGVKVGSTSYSPSSGIVSLPAYPTTLPASDVSSWAKASTKPTYTASEVGLGNVGNFKAVSTVASQGLSSTEKSNARANIGAGTSSFSGSYSDLSNKPTIPTKTSQLTNDSGYTTNTGTVTGVKVGSTSYSPSSGVVSLPEYPTTLPANGGTAENVSGIVAIANGGTGAKTASGARVNLGLGSAATRAYTTSITSGSSSLITSGAVYDAIQMFKATAPSNLTRSNLDNLEDGDITGWFADTIGPISNHWVTIQTRSYVNGSDVHKIQHMTSANGYELTRKYSPDTGWVPWSGFGSVDASINLSQLTFTKTYSGNGWFYSGNIDYSTYFRNIYSAMIYDFNFVLCKLGINIAIDSTSGTKCYLIVSDPDNSASLSFTAAATLDIRLFGMRLY